MTDPTEIILKNTLGASVSIIPTGAVIQKLILPDKDDNLDDIVLGFETHEPYKDGSSPYFGAVVGRVANRIANATFHLDGKQYKLAANNGPNTLHGGVFGFSRQQWTLLSSQTTNDDADQYAALTYTSVDGEEGFPGTVTATVTYTLSHTSNTLTTLFTATTTAPTLVNMAQHSYFNLAGHASFTKHTAAAPGSTAAELGPGMTILDHELALFNATHYTPVNDAQIPLGEIIPVADTLMDFTKPMLIGEHVKEIPGPGPGGYDHNYVLFGMGADAKEKVDVHGMAHPTPQLAASLKHAPSGRAMKLYTTAPAVQLYSGNFLDGSLVGKYGVRYPRYGGLCLETQGFPDAINQPNFPSVVLRPEFGEYRHAVVYEFYITK